MKIRFGARCRANIESNQMRTKRFVTVAVLLVALACFTSSPALGEMYKWTDERGVVHFSDTAPPKSGDVEIVKPSQREPMIKGQPERPLDEGGTAYAAPGRAPRVELYVTSWCPHCRRARDFLRQNRIAFVEYDIEQDAAAASRRKQIGDGTGVPVAIIGDKVISGFSPESYANALGLKPR